MKKTCNMMRSKPERGRSYVSSVFESRILDKLWGCLSIREHKGVALVELH